MDIFNNKKSQVGYFIQPYSAGGNSVPLGIFNNAENNQVKGVNCPSVTSSLNRIYEIKSFLDIEIIFGLDKFHAPFYRYELSQNHPYTDEIHNFVRNNILINKEKNGLTHLQLVSPYFLVTDDKDLELMTLQPDVVMENCKYINGAYYPYSWIRNTNSTYSLTDKDKEARIVFSLDSSFMKWVFNKKVDLYLINPTEEILNYQKQNQGIVNFRYNMKSIFNNVAKRRTKKLLNKNLRID